MCGGECGAVYNDSTSRKDFPRVCYAYANQRHTHVNGSMDTLVTYSISQQYIIIIIIIII